MSAPTDGEREVFRLAPPVILWWVWVAFVAVNAVDYAVQGLPSARFGAVVASVLLLVTALVYTLALRPQVIASDDGITVVNPYRTHFVPWRLITSVDTGEWVKVHYAPAAGDAAAGDAAAEDAAGSKIVHCWALYVSARARRKIAAGPPRPRDPLPRGPRGLRRLGRAAVGLGAGPGPGAAVGYAQPPSSRLPEEARYLASLPPAKAIAVRLDTLAGRERARAANGVIHDDSLDNSKKLSRVTIAPSWPAIAAVAVPAATLLAIAVA